MNIFLCVIYCLKVNGESLGMDCVDYNTDKTIIDCGTTNLRLPENVFHIFTSFLKQAVRFHLQYFCSYN